MQTSDWALTISLLSFAVSLGGLAWNVWSKFIFPKPRLVVELSYLQIVDLEAAGPFPASIRLAATNHGPIALTLNGVALRMRHPDGRKTMGLPRTQLHPLEDGPGAYGAGFPRILGVGETYQVYFPSVGDSVFRRGVYKVGITDSFGRRHWVPRKSIDQVIRGLKATYPDLWTRESLTAFMRGSM